MMNLNIDVHLNMERGMYERLVERAQELGVPLSAVVRDAVALYFANVPAPPERNPTASIPDDPIWSLPGLSAVYGDLTVPASSGPNHVNHASHNQSEGGQR
jgi:hypothetical protein